MWFIYRFITKKNKKYIFFLNCIPDRLHEQKEILNYLFFHLEGKPITKNTFPERKRRECKNYHQITSIFFFFRKKIKTKTHNTKMNNNPKYK